MPLGFATFSARFASRFTFTPQQQRPQRTTPLPTLARCVTLSAALLGGGVMSVGFMSVERAWGAPAEGSQERAPSKTTPAQAHTSPKTSAQPKQNWRLGVVQIESDLSAGQVELEGKTISDFPMPGPWTLSPGKYTLTLRDGSWSQTRVLQIKAGELVKLSIYRDPSKMPSEAPEEEELEEEAPKEPEVERFHPGAGFSVSAAGYTLLSLGVAGLGYGVYEQLQVNSLRLEASNTPNSQAALRDERYGDAAGAAWRANLSLRLGAVALVSGAAFVMLGREGWLSAPSEPEVKVAPVFGPSSQRAPSSPTSAPVRWALTPNEGGAFVQAQGVW